MSLILFILTLTISGSEISLSNQLKREIKTQMESGDYESAERNLIFLKDSLKIKDTEVYYNLATSLYNKGNKKEAFGFYDSVAHGNDPELASRAYQQMGSILYEQQDLNNSLTAFKNSILKNPQNKESRYNYELVKKKLKEQGQENQSQDQNQKDQQDQKQKNQDQQNQDQQNQDQQNQDQQKQDQNQQEKEQQNQDQENQDQDQENQDQEKQQQEEQEQEEQGENSKKEESEGDKEEEKKEEQKPEEGEGEQIEKEEQQQAQPNKEQPNFEELKISPEMAKMILQAMENREMQYFQQLKKEPTKSSNGKSKW